jgi:hypothetical protein
LFHACLIIGLNKLTKCLNSEVAIKVAATDTTAVDAAVTTIAVLGTGTSISVPGIPSICTSGGVNGGGLATGTFVLGVALGGSSLASGSIPGGGLRSLGGTTKGL